MSNELMITMPSDREVSMTRVFDAPRKLVFDTWTKPELLRRWLGVRNGWTMTVCEIDLKVGGTYRYVWTKTSNGMEMGMGGEYREVVTPQRLVATERFDAPFDAGEALDTTVLIEKDGKTTVTTTVYCESKEARDAVLGTGMAKGVEESYAKLDELLATL
jgi:uncharacterized protein YndB with AHSA1/START domain